MNTEMIDSMNDVLTSYNVKAGCVDAGKHRHFGFFDIELNRGCKVNDIVKLSQEISLAMKTKNIISARPVPELGIVRLRAIMDVAKTLHADDLHKRHGGKKGVLPLLLGETDEGKPLFMDMEKNPHIIVAGATGSGKSVLLHNIIDNVARLPKTELYLVDPKLVEFSVYKNFEPVQFIANDYERTIKMLKHLQHKMEKRYIALAKMGLKSIEERPDLFRKTVIVIDEVADIILQDKDKKFEELLIALAQKARAAGIYIVLATQRPSVDVITGLIKANFPGRIACKVASMKNSQIILDEPGAEALAGRGDAIIKNPVFDSARFQVAFVDPKKMVKNFNKRS